MGYTHLTREERYQIYALHKAGHSGRRIAQLMGRSAATVSREMRRNRGRRGYRPHQAQAFAQARHRACERTRIPAAVWGEVERLLALEWSPEQIAGRLGCEQGVAISHEWIYCHILADKHSGGTLYRYLRCQKRRRKRYGAYSRRGVIPGAVSIEKRPAIVARRGRIGDWEGDTVIGHARRGALVTLVERKSRYTLLGHVPRKSAAAVRRAVRLRMAGYRVHTLTYDNGREFADHCGMATDLKARIFFAHPYASWERGLNENTNGLIRQYFPKHRELGHVTEPELERVMNRLNHRPRKSLNFKTPHEVLFKTRSSLTVALQS